MGKIYPFITLGRSDARIRRILFAAAQNIYKYTMEYCDVEDVETQRLRINVTVASTDSVRFEGVEGLMFFARITAEDRETEMLFMVPYDPTYNEGEAKILAPTPAYTVPEGNYQWN